jgi:hypothetical protein
MCCDMVLFLTPRSCLSQGPVRAVRPSRGAVLEAWTGGLQDSYATGAQMVIGLYKPQRLSEQALALNTLDSSLRD